MKILVIGAGPSGLTAAAALTAKGIECRIVERRTAPSELSRAVGILPATIRLLQELNSADAILAEAMPLRKIHLTRHGKTLLKLNTGGEGFEDRIIRGLPQNRTEEILRDLQSRGIAVEYGLEVTGISTDTQIAEVSLSDGSNANFDWVIAADGINSITRSMLNIPYPGYDLPDPWSIADVDVEGEFDPELVQLDVQGKNNTAIIILPIEARRARIVASSPDALATFAEFDHPLQIANTRRTGTFTISVRQAESYQKGRILLAGDSAHCHSPVGGRGMNLGMADAAAAVDAIINAQTDNYTHQRHEIGRKVLNTTEAARRMVVSNNPLSALGLSLAAGAIGSVPAARRAFLRRFSEF